MATKHHRGTAGFIAIRATSVLLAFLTVWFVWGIAAHAGASTAQMLLWVSQPATAILFALFLALSAWHMAMGMNEVIEDYIHSGMKGIFMTLNWLVAVAVAGASIFAAIKLAV
jgi:succinate dehydrogenase / fumarate reductase membrane anchor subunit